MAKRLFTMRKTEHEQINEQLSAYVDRQLSGGEMARVEAHARVCEVCRRDLDTLRWTKSLLREVPVVKVPRSFVIREADIAPRRTSRRPRFVFATQWATAVVAMLLVLVLAGDVLSGRLLQGAAVQPASEVAVEGEAVVERVVAVEEQAETEARTVVVEKEVVVKTVVVEKEVVVETVVVEEREVLPEQALAAEAPSSPTPTPGQGTGGGGEKPEADRVPGMDATTGTPLAASKAGDRAEAFETEPTAVPAEAEGEVIAEPGDAPPPEATPSPVPLAAVQPPQEEQPVTVAPPEVAQPQWAFALTARPTRIIWRTVEIALALGLVALAITLIWMRRRA